MELTDRQTEILDFIRDTVAAPSLRELMQKFCPSSTATVASHLNLVEKKAATRRQPGRNPNIILPDYQPPVSLWD